MCGITSIKKKKKKIPKLLLHVSHTSKHFWLHTRPIHFSRWAVEHGAAALTHLSFLTKTLQALKHSYPPFRSGCRAPERITLSFTRLPVLAKQLLLKSQVQIVVKLHVTGANLKIPSFLEGLDRLPGYKWDIFSKAVLLEVLIRQHLHWSSSSPDMLFCSGKCGLWISE